MHSLGLSLDELLEVVRTCAAIEWNHCTSPYLQDFIVPLSAVLKDPSREVRQAVRAALERIQRK